MQLLYRKLLVVLVFTAVLPAVSCNKSFLEIEPKGFVIAKTTGDYEQMMNAAFITTLFTASGLLSDDVAANQTFFDAADLRMQRLFRFEDRVYQPDELPQEINGEFSYMRKLYLFNKIINEVMTSTGGTEEQKRAIQAEAKVGRAVCHLAFVNDFAIPYNEATASTDPGIPLITKAEVTETKFVRSSIKEVYDLIVKDLTEALPDLGPVVHRRKFSKAAGEFYLARALLYMGKFTEAKTHVDGAFTALAGASIPLALYDYNTVLDPDAPDTWFPDLYGIILANKPIVSANTQTIYSIEMSTFFINTINTFVFTPQTAALFDPADKRLNLYAGGDAFGGAFAYPNGMRRYSASLFQDIGPSLPDLYLMRAELKARANDLTGAKDDLELLREKRMPANIAEVPASIASNQDDLVRFVFDERIREFALSGMRWFDMRRLSVDPKYNNTVKYTHMIYDDDGNVVQTYTLNPKRFALKFGERMLAENQGLEENP